MFSKTGLVVILFGALLLLGCAQSGSTNENGSVSAPVLISTQNNSLNSLGGSSMAVKNGDTVKVDYVGSTQGVVFDTSIESEAKKAGLPRRPSYEPLQFTVGAHQVVPGFEYAVLGMKAGEQKTAVLAPKDAYGEKNPQAIIQVPKTAFAPNSSLTVGSQVQSPQGMPGFITNVSASNVTIDFNPPLAGKTLTFTIWLRDIVPK